MAQYEPYTTPTNRPTDDSQQAPDDGVASDGQSVIEEAQYEGAVVMQQGGTQHFVTKGAPGRAVPSVPNSGGGSVVTRNNAGVVVPYNDPLGSFPSDTVGRA